jgi:hypothetical protein
MILAPLPNAIISAFMPGKPASAISGKKLSYISIVDRI